MAKRVKKWFMLQVWRLQQVAQVLTLVLLALNLSVTIFDQIKWREDSPLSISYVGVPMILMVLAMAIWTFAIIWDVRLKMWRDQATVLMERNPYVKERMTPKEVILYGVMWLPLIEKVGESDPKMKEAAEALKKWLAKSVQTDDVLARDVREVIDHIGRQDSTLLDFIKRQ